MLTIVENTAFNILYNGSSGRDRTYDQLINSQLHYRCATLEYLVPPVGFELTTYALQVRCSTK
jgi:hypothetical protein